MPLTIAVVHERDKADTAREACEKTRREERRAVHRTPAVIAAEKPTLMSTETWLGVLDDADQREDELIKLGALPDSYGGLSDLVGEFAMPTGGVGPTNGERAGTPRPAQHKLDWAAMKQAMRRLVDQRKVRNVRELRAAAYEYANDGDEKPTARRVRDYVNDWAAEWQLPAH